MRDVDRALSDIADIRRQLAAGTMFRGFGPTVIAASGVLAIVTASMQSMLPQQLASDPVIFLACWVATAVAAVVLIAIEMIARSRRHHGGMATAMIVNAIEQFLPAGAAGLAVACVFAQFAPDAYWMLPGLWQIFVALGLFSALRSLPSAMALVGGWYFVAGVVVLIIGAQQQALTPWMMGAPFMVGQFLMAAVLHVASEDRDASAE